MTYGEILEEFINTTHIDRQLIDDYRPCCDLFDVPSDECLAEPVNLYSHKPIMWKEKENN